MRPNPAGPGVRPSVAAGLRALLLVVAINLGIGSFLTVLMGTGLADNLIASQSIGLSIFAFNILAVLLWPARRVPMWLLASTVVLGAAAGVLLSGLATGHLLPSALIGHPRRLLVVLSSVVVFGTGVTYYFHSRRHLALAAADLHGEQLRNAQAAQQLAEIRLKLLQAQIEPHFLFNTLSNVASLIDPAPLEAKAMLEHLTAYLRVGLQRTRHGTSPLAQELELLHAYLEIHAIRLGERLRYSIPEAGALGQLALPPLLIQPLVENAVVHGIEPQIAGGRIDVTATSEAGHLQIEVADTGRGMGADWGAGVGLQNVRQRLAGLYGEAASLTLRANVPSGVVATLRLPIARP